jgi:hypothetical protein
MLIISKSANHAYQVIQLRDSLIQARQVAEQLQRQADNATAEELQEVQGVPVALNAPYLATLASVLTSLQSASVELFIGAVA